METAQITNQNTHQITHQTRNEYITHKLTSHLQSLQDSGITREIDEEWLGSICALVGIPKDNLALCSHILSKKPLSNLVWLHLAECSGCTESILRLDKIDVGSLMFKYIRFEYHETLMGSAGFLAKDILDKLDSEDFILVVEGGVPFGESSLFFTSGASGTTGEQECRHLASKAEAIFAVGTCSSFGGVQAAYPNPTNAVGLDTFLEQKVVNISGCPPSDTNIVASIMYYILMQEYPPLDSLNRPLWSYGKSLHDMCERKVRFDSGDFVQSFDDIHMQNGYCLYKVGCKGPYTFNNCPKVKFNSKTSWPIQAGHGCIACSEPNFWDSFGYLEEPPNNTSAYNAKPKVLNIFTLDTSKNKPLEQILHICLDSKSQTRIYTQAESKITESKDFLALDFESNLLALLQQISSKNKLGARLVENYHKWAESQKINLNGALDSRRSQNLSDVFRVMYEMFVGLGGKDCDTSYEDFMGEMCEDFRQYDILCKKEFLNAAQSYLYPHISRFDFKLRVRENINENIDKNIENTNESVASASFSIEIDKAMRTPLSYLLGGLEMNGVAYSAVSCVCEVLSQAITQICKQENIHIITFSGDMAESLIIQDRLLAYLPKWIRIV
ncbi:hydrogenase small subunit [Helicobacter fennelliae]|uniref:Uptake hydrogenase small subunit n=1 Tax=Helicobacter fennelliae MRY12-0050 TaxID=1325130 RepID=T1CNN4_9HELI|nr:hydrogenase small subunit [Helicobacter fennelliae]GAD18394.1 uptake hydrogenase small subunit precursor [Helicobacter fennelliae MRY12-0050]STP14375.1 putative Ni/Fe-hydrogenase small subunit [Helicobacter fennelliae]